MPRCSRPRVRRDRGRGDCRIYGIFPACSSWSAPAKWAAPCLKAGCGSASIRNTSRCWSRSRRRKSPPWRGAVCGSTRIRKRSASPPPSSSRSSRRSPQRPFRSSASLVSAVDRRGLDHGRADTALPRRDARSARRDGARHAEYAGRDRARHHRRGAAQRRRRAARARRPAACRRPERWSGSTTKR